MKESIGTSLSWIKTNAVRMGLLPFNKRNEVVRVIEADNDVELRSKVSNDVSAIE